MNSQTGKNDMTATYTKQLTKLTDDPINAYYGQLPNGLSVYMSVNDEEPRIQTQIVVKAGFQDDPDEATGLAHYFEHMMFKGSDRMGTLDWNRESELLGQIEQLFEDHRETTDPEQKKHIYTRIDELSAEAAKYALPNEYDKLLSAIGAKDTNAYTSFDQTGFLNNIPANELERWLKIEQERFRNPVMRLFHTELETVYEEFNMRTQDSDQGKVFDAVFRGLFQEHNYGRQPVIGKPEHLKNPSMREIYRFFETHYAPNNMAICLSGDLDPEKTLDLIEQYFGHFNPVDQPENPAPQEPDLEAPVVKEARGQETESLTLAYRLNGANSEDAKYMKVLEGLLYNERAGLIDLNLNQRQAVMQAMSAFVPLKDYSLLVVNGIPRSGQSLEEVRQLIYEQIENLKSGAFEPWMMEAVVNDLRLKRKEQLAQNSGRVEAFVDAFSNEVPWETYVAELVALSGLTKDALVTFAQENLTTNHVAVYKRQETDPDTVHLEKPPLTPVDLNREGQSEFFKEVMAIPSSDMEPEFLDFERDIQHSRFQDRIPFHYIPNPVNDTFTLYFIFDMGSDHDLVKSLALRYLPYLGTDQYSPDGIRQAFFHLGITYQTTVQRDQFFIYLHGLEESLSDGVALLLHLLQNAQPDEEALAALIDTLLKEREDEKADKQTILRKAMVNFGKFGYHNPFTNRLSRTTLQEQKAETLVDEIHNLLSYQHRIFYYGQAEPGTVQDVLGPIYPQTAATKTLPEPRHYEPLDTDQQRVYTIDYDMVQSEIVMLARDTLYNPELTPHIALFNEYFGGGLSSLVFQEIRESKALAYSAFSFFTQPRTNQEAHYLLSYLGTQADKLKEALRALQDLVVELPNVPDQFAQARESVIKQIATERITRTKIFWAYEENRKRGITHDQRKDVYEQMQHITFDELKAFFDQHVKGKPFIYLVLGSREHLDFNVLQSLGPVENLHLDTLFNDQ